MVNIQSSHGSFLGYPCHRNNPPRKLQHSLKHPPSPTMKGIPAYIYIYIMGVSKNSGTPKSSIFIGFSIINHPFWGFYPYFWKHPYSLLLLGCLGCFPARCVEKKTVGKPQALTHTHPTSEALQALMTTDSWKAM